MRLVHETEDIDGNEVQYMADADHYLVRLVFNTNGHLESETITIIDGECACRSCNDSRDWSKFK